MKLLNLQVLAYRRLRGDVIEMHKHFRIYDKEIIADSFQRKLRANWGHNLQIYELRAKYGTRSVQHNSFYYRTARLWNQLPEDVVNAPTTNSFKNRLDKCWNDLPMKFSYNEENMSNP